ncbi:MAG: hypothetical protein ACJAY8_001111 [Sphingobacteriales bacterium]|jgi:hypothetical protein
MEEPIMDQISNRTLISRLYSSAEQQLLEAEYDIESWTQWYAVVQALTDPEKMVYIIVKLNKTVTNGGFSEFYESSMGVFAPEIIHVLSEIKAIGTAEVVGKTLSVVNPAGLLDDDYKNFIFKIALTEQQRVQLYAQDMGYDQLHDQENLEDLLGGYLQALFA